MNNNQYSIYHEWKNWTSQTFGQASSELKTVYSSIIKKYHLVQDCHAIDFGFGNGEMLTVLRSMGFTVFGVECNNYLCQLATYNGYLVANSLGDLQTLSNKNNFSLITAFHVLEHLNKSDLQATMCKFSELISEDGVIIAAFPNGDSPFSMSAFNGDITHQTLIGSSMAEQIGRRAQLKLVAYERFPSSTVNSDNLTVRYKGLFRELVERFLNGILSRVYFGSGYKELSPVALAVWKK